MTETKVTRELLERALAREEKAFKEVVMLVAPSVRARITTLLFRRGIGFKSDVKEDAKQFCQEVLEKLFVEDDGHHARRWEPERGPFEPYAALFAEDRVAGWLRKKSERPLPEPEDVEDVPIPDSSQTPERIFESRELIEKILHFLREEVSDLGRTLIDLLFVEHREVDEICERMGMTPDAVYQWRSRLLKRMKVLAIEMGGGR